MLSINKSSQKNKLNINIYGDGIHEYEWYYLVVVEEFNSNNTTLNSRKKSFYLKDVNRLHHEMVEYIKDNIDLFWNGKNNTRYEVINPSAIKEGF